MEMEGKNTKEWLMRQISQRKEEEGAMQRAGGYMSLGGRRGHFLPELSVEEHGVWYYI